MKKLFLDDVREPHDDSYEIVRSYEEAITWLEKNGCPDLLALDHDLGMALVDGKLKCVDYACKNGIDVVEWIIQKDIELGGTFIPQGFIYTIHSSNKSGSENMNRAFKGHLESRV
jgi:CheY-like chemotaxis protein